MSSTRLEAINDELGGLISDERKKKVVDIQEEVFRRKLLPVAVSRYSNIDREIDLTHWQAITGESPTYGVRVMRGSEFLFETPPLILSPEVTFEGGALLRRLKEAERLEKAGLPKGDLMDADKLKPSLRVKGLQQALITWVYIFRYFGIVLDPVDDDGNVISSSVENIENSPSEPTEKTNMGQWDDDDEEMGHL